MGKTIVLRFYRSSGHAGCSETEYVVGQKRIVWLWLHHVHKCCFYALNFKMKKTTFPPKTVTLYKRVQVYSIFKCFMVWHMLELYSYTCYSHMKHINKNNFSKIVVLKMAMFFSFPGILATAEHNKRVIRTM